MAKWGNADFEQLKALKSSLEKFEEVDADALCVEISKKLAAMLLALVIPKTPKKTGLLHRSWRAGTSGGNEINVVKRGGEYRCAIYNPTEYASYVEFGHRIMIDGENRGFVPGKYMLTISEEKLKNESPAIIQKMLEDKLREVMNGKD